MLTPEYLEYCVDDIVRLYSQLDESIIRDITRRIIKTGNISETARWQIEKAQQGGLLYDDVIAEIAKITDATENHIKALFEDAGIKSVEYDNVIYEKAGLPIPPTRMSPVAYQMLAAGANKTTGNLKNLTMTTANTAQSAFINACTMAEMQIESGAFDYKTAIRNAVKNASKQGTTVLYPSGHTDKLDVAVRRAVLTGVSQTTGQVALQNAKDMDCDLMEITAHSGARPDHAVWQGRIVSLSGQKGYFSLNDIGYGTGAGFKGWNCRHDWFPYFEGISKRAYSEEDLQAIENETITYNDKSYTEYEATQIQRKMERTIRATRRELVGLNELAKNGDTVAKAEFESLSVKLKKQEEKLKDFCNTTDRNINTFRVQVDGFNKSVSRKAVWANKKTVAKSSFTELPKIFDTEKIMLKNNDIEHGILYNTRGEIILTKDGEKHSISFTDNEKKLMKGAVFTHNHPSNSPPSPADIYNLYTYELKEVRAVTKYGVYSVKQPKYWKNELPNRYELNNIFNKNISKVIPKIKNQLNNGKITPEQADNYCWRFSIRRMERLYGFKVNLIRW